MMPHTDAKPITEEPDRAMRLFAVLQKALSHELPNMLIGVQGLGRLLELEQGERLSAEGRDYLERMIAGTAKAHALVTALADVARLGKGRDAAGAMDLAEVVTEAVAEANQVAQHRFAEYHGAKQVLILTVPRAALRKVLGLLLRRAGTICPGAPPRRVEVSTRITETEVAIRVAEDRPVLFPEQIARLFEPFGGTDDHGLEMFLLRQLVEDWGGVVRVESEPASGTVFVVTCPLGIRH